MRNRLFLKLFGAFLLLGVTATLPVDLAARWIWKRSLAREVEQGLTQKAKLIAALAERVAARDLQAFARQQSAIAGARVTIIASDGRVLADSEHDPATMENHAARPEVAAALRGGKASSTRQSATIGVRYFYLAIPFRGGALRLATPMAELQTALQLATRSVILISLLSLALAALLAGLYTRGVTARIEEVKTFAEQVASGNLSARVEERGGDELAQMATALNLTARRLEENFRQLQYSRDQLDSVLNSMQESVLAVSSDRRIAWANERMSKLLGEGLKMGNTLVETVRDPEILRSIQTVLETRTAATGRSQLLFPGRTFQVNVAPLPEGGAVAVWLEITAIEQMEKTRRDFIANVSHELRTPLTSVQGYAETLAEMASDAEQQELIEVVRKNAARMAGLTEDLLALARVESGEDKLDLQTMEPVELLKDLPESAAALLKAQGQRLEIENAAHQPVKADADKIRQVFLNLIENACRYGKSAQGITAGSFDEGREVYFYVRDHGPGIASEHLPRIFERFYRIDRARAGSAETGTGLGLAIAKHVVIKHGGRIWAESELNAGSTFYFSLPALAAVGTSAS